MKRNICLLGMLLLLVTFAFAQEAKTTTDPWGNTKTIYTDPYGNTTGEAKTTTDPWGNKKTIYTDPYGNPIP